MCHNDLHTLLKDSADIFKKEPAIIHIESANVMIVGDVHGNLKALEFIIRMREELKCKKIVFLGDYVDRGKNSVAVLCQLLELKVRETENIILLRGNHETMEMNSIYGFYDEVQDHDLFLAANRTFKEMPVAALINDTVFCVHGGIPGTVNVDEISKLNSFPYLWNDPSTLQGMTASIRGLRPQCFGPDIFKEFMEQNHLSLMIRAHTAIFNGYEWWFGKSLLSIFSTPGYAGNENVAAFSVLKGKELNIFVFGKAADDNYMLLCCNSNNILIHNC